MASFTILVMIFLVKVLYSMVKDIINNNYKCLGKQITATILLLIAVYLKSMGQ